MNGSAPSSAHWPVTAREGALVFLAYASFTLLVTWPLGAAPGSLATGNPDTYAALWTVAWVARQLSRDPLRLFDANIFWPEPQALAFTESLLPQSLVAAPIQWLGGSPVLAHNVALLLTFPLGGLGLYVLARDLGVDRTGAFLGGLGYAFCAHRFRNVIGIKSISTQWFPFALLFLRRALRHGRAWDGLGLGTASLLQALSSPYFAVLLVPTLGIGLLAGLRGALARGTLLRALAPLVVSAAISAMLLWPHRAAQQRHNLTRSRQALVHWSAKWNGFLDPGPYVVLPHLRRLHENMAARDGLYPGSFLLVFGVAGVGLLRRSPEARFAFALATVGLLLSLGPEVSLGPWVLPGPLDALHGLPGSRGSGHQSAPSRWPSSASACWRASPGRPLHARGCLCRCVRRRCCSPCWRPTRRVWDGSCIPSGRRLLPRSGSRQPRVGLCSSCPGR